MIHTMENGRLRIAVAEKGAELQSVCETDTGREYLWQGDPAVWARRAPLLFPFVGRLKDDAFTHAGKRYAMAKHGFAMDAAFAPARAGRDAIRLVLEDVEGARAGYPFPFRLAVRYALADNAVHIEHTVDNPGRETLYFSLGAHPGFVCAMGDALVFERAEALRPYRLTAEKLLSSAPEGACGQGRIVITPALFARDALIFQGLSSRAVRLARQGNLGDVEVRFGRVPCLGIWAVAGAPYVCIEPWFGVDDSREATGRLEEKRHIQALPPGGRFVFPMTIVVNPP